MTTSIFIKLVFLLKSESRHRVRDTSEKCKSTINYLKYRLIFFIKVFRNMKNKINIRRNLIFLARYQN